MCLCMCINKLYCVVLFRVVSVSCCFVLCRVVSFCVVLCHVVSFCVVLFRVVSFCVLLSWVSKSNNIKQKK